MATRAPSRAKFTTLAEVSSYLDTLHRSDVGKNSHCITTWANDTGRQIAMGVNRGESDARIEHVGNKGPIISLQGADAYEILRRTSQS